MLSVSGGTEPYTFAVTAGSLPDGLDLDASTGQITGTPTTAGSEYFTVTATDDTLSIGQATYSITVATQAPPTITEVDPPSGQAGAAVTITGTGFFSEGTSSSRVFFVSFVIGGLPYYLDSPNFSSDTTITGTMPPVPDGFSGAVSLRLETFDGTFTFPNTFTYIAPPTPPEITQTSPPSGPTAGGNLVSISGAHFTGTTAVTFDGVDAEFEVVSDIEISATAPAHDAGTVDIAVTTPDGTDTAEDAYTYEASDDAGLSGLVLSAGTLSPDFGTNVLSYTAQVPFEADSVTVTPTASYASATIAVDSTPVSSGSVSSPISLDVGDNPITVVVTAEDGTTKRTYTVTVTRAASSNAALAGLVPSSGTLDPAFNAGTFGYTLTVGNATDSLTITPTTTDSTATITVNGTQVTSGSASGPINLNVGPNTVTVLVTAQDGTTTETYTVTVTRAASSNATLAGLAPSAGTLNPAFDAGTFGYGLALGNDVESLTVTPTAAEPNATITVNGDTVTSGSPSQPISLDVGPNTITVLVTAQDGTTSETYTITVTRAASSNAALSGLSVDQGSLSPSFDSGQFDYTLAIGSDVEEIRITPTAAHGNATITVDGIPVASGSASAPIPVDIGTATAIDIVVTAEDGVTKWTYTITVDRALPDPTKDPEVTGLLNAQSDSAKGFAQSQIQNFGDRLEQLHDEGDRRRNSMEIAFGITGSEPISSPMDALLDEEDETLPESMLAYGTDGVSESASAPRAIGDGFDLGRYAVWTGGFVNFGERDDGGLDLEHTMVGVSGGLDYRFSDRFVAGFGAGYGHDKSDIGGNGTESRGEAYSAALYGSYEPVENFFIDGLIGGSRLDFDSSRYITENGGFASGERDGWQVFGSITAAYQFRNEAWLLSPYGRFEFSRSWLDAFTEEGGDIYTLSYGDQTVDSLSGVLGFRTAYTFLTGWGSLTPGFRAEYTHDFAGSSRVDLGYADLDDLTYSLETDPERRDYGTLGLSLDAEFAGAWAAGFDYRSSFDGESQDHAIGIEVRKGF